MARKDAKTQFKEKHKRLLRSLCLSKRQHIIIQYASTSSAPSENKTSFCGSARKKIKTYGKEKN
jgi:hypothetical protein